MNEERYDVRPYGVRLICDQPDCDGEMKYSGMAFMSAPPTYPHRCEKCGAEQRPREKYPLIRWDRVDPAT